MADNPPVDAIERRARIADEASIDLMAQAESFQIATPEHFETSGELLRTIKAKQKEVADTRTGITKPMDAAKKRVMDLFKPVTERLAAAELTIKGAMIVFTRAEEERQREAQVERERVAEVERKRLARRAEAAREDGAEEKADVLEETAAAVQAPPAAAPTKAAGVHTRTIWKAEVTNKRELIKAAATDAGLVPYLEVDLQKLNALARSLKGEMAIPGVRAVSEETVTARAG